MPTYDYRCEACSHEFEAFQSITAKSLRKCPECGKMKLRRLIGTGAGIIFKGSGFYETDYRSDSYKKAAKAEKESSTKSESKGESKKTDSATTTSSTAKKSTEKSTSTASSSAKR